MFENMNKQFNADELELVWQKNGVYPYEFMDNTNQFEYPKFQSKANLYSSLILSGISDDNYNHALTVYDNFNCSKFLDQHMLQLNCGVCRD